MAAVLMWELSIGEARLRRTSLALLAERALRTAPHLFKIGILPTRLKDGVPILEEGLIVVHEA